MNRMLVLFVIGLVFGAGAGFTFAAGNGIALDGHDHAEPAHHMAADIGHGATDDHAGHNQMPIDISSADAPALSISVTADPVAGHNLQVQVQDFVFAPENASLAHVSGQGHAHVYVNGSKVARLYGPWLHLSGLPDGMVDISVSLNSNDHRPLAIEGEPIMAIETIHVE